MVRLTIAILQNLFLRPILVREFKKCGFEPQVDAPLQATRQLKLEEKRRRS